MDRPADRRGAGDQSQQCLARPQALVEEGFEAVLTRQYNPACARPKIFDGDAEAKLIAVACSKPPDGRAHWTLRLLEEKVVELGIVARASDNTIGRIERSRLRRRSGVEIVVDVRRLRKQTNLVRVVANAPFFAACLCAEFRVLWWGAATAKKCRIDRR